MKPVKCWWGIRHVRWFYGFLCLLLYLACVFGSFGVVCLFWNLDIEEEGERLDRVRRGLE